MKKSIWIAAVVVISGVISIIKPYKAKASMARDYFFYSAAYCCNATKGVYCGAGQGDCYAN